MSVATVLGIVGPLVVASVANDIDVRVHEQLSCHLHHLSEQVEPSRALQVLAQQLCRAHVVVGGHRIFSFVNLAFLKAGAVAVASGGCSARSNAQRELVTPGLYTTLADSTHRGHTREVPQNDVHSPCRRPGASDTESVISCARRAV